MYLCHHSTYRKVAYNENKKGLSKNSGCGASISVTIKKNTAATRKKDEFIKVGTYLLNLRFKIIIFVI